MEGERDKAQLSDVQQALARAWVAGDRAAIERIIAPEWTTTGPDGGKADRATVLAQVFETRVHTIQQLEIDDVQVRVFGDGLATGPHGVGTYAGARCRHPLYRHCGD